MIEIEVEGFQSIERVKVSVEGFAALVGRSNIGKSAIIRAVKYALTNAEGKGFVRHPDNCLRKVKKAKTCKCQTTVRIRTEGFDLTWERGDAVNRYLFNGTEYDKPDRGTPDFLTQFGFGTLKVGDEKVAVQVSDQFDPLFLVNKSGSAVAETISDVGRLDRINSAMRSVERDRKEAASTRKVREKDVAELRDRLVPYVRLDHDLTNIRTVEQQLNQVQQKSGTVDRLTRYISNVTNLKGQIDQLQTASSVAVPDLAHLDAKRKAYEAVARFVDQLSLRAGRYRALQWVEKMPDLSSDAFQTAAKKYQQLTGWVDKAIAAKQRFNVLKEVENVTPPVIEPVKEKFASLLVIERLCTRYTKTCASISSYDGVESVLSSELEYPSRAPELLSHIAYLEQAERKLRVLAGAVEKLNQEYAKASDDERAVQAEVDALGVCPTCTQPLHLHAEEHPTAFLTAEA